MTKLEKFLLEKECLVYSEQGDWFFTYKVITEIKSLYVGHLYLEEEFRGKDFSDLIWKVVSDKARELGCVQVSCDVDLYQNKPELSLGFLTKLGFIKTGQDEDFIYLYKNIED